MSEILDTACPYYLPYFTRVALKYAQYQYGGVLT